MSGAINWQTIVDNVESYEEPVEGMGHPAVVKLDGAQTAAQELVDGLRDVQQEIYNSGMFSENHRYVMSPSTSGEVNTLLNRMSSTGPDFKKLNGVKLYDEPYFPDGYILLVDPDHLLMSGELVYPRSAGLVKNVPYDD